MNFFSFSGGRKAKGRISRNLSQSLATRGRHEALLQLEALEDRFLPSASPAATVISGSVYYDLNNSGLFTSQDPAIAGNTIQLHAIRNGQDTILGTTTTDANGGYSFDHDATVPTAPQTITKTLTFASTPTDFTLSGLVGQFNTALGTLQSVQITNAGSITSNIEVENTSTSSPSTISATVGGKEVLTAPGGVSVETDMQQNAGSFGATTYDGVLDFGGTSGKNFGANTANGSQAITLTGAAMSPFEGAGSILLTENGSATSNASGGGNLLASISSSGAAQVTVVYTYILNNSLVPGNYTVVQVNTPPGYVPGKITSNGTPVVPPPGVRAIPITIAVGTGTYPHNNFAELKASSVAGYVYADTSAGGYNDGIKGPGEPGVGGVYIALDGSDQNGVVHKLLQTDANGYYDFTGLLPGNYIVSMAPPSGWVDGKDTAGTPGGTVVKDAIINIDLPGGFDGTNNNFGLLQPATASLGGIAYLDVSPGGWDNGVRDASEAGIGGVKVTLHGVDNFNNPLTMVTTTDAIGNYLFSNLPAGTYQVVETRPLAYLDGKTTVGDHGGTAAQDVLSNIVLQNDAHATYYNFASLIPSTLSGYVYLDTGTNGTNNGVMDAGEAGIANVTLTLTGTDDLGPVSRTLTTNASGYYAFTGLRPGMYQITETSPAGYLDGKDSIGSQGGLVGHDVLYSITLPPNVNGVSNNFAELTPVISASPPGVIAPTPPAPASPAAPAAPGTPQLPPDLVNAPAPTTPAIPVISKAELVITNGAIGDPSVIADARYINTLYHVILGRDVETTALANWLVYLRSGGTRASLVQQIINSTENRTRQVTAIYQTIVGSAPPQNVLSWYVNQMMVQGASEIQVAASIMSSPQAQALYPNYPAFVNELYQLIVGRNAAPGEQNYWQSLYVNPQNMALQVFMSAGSLSNIVSNAYTTLLGRPASLGEIQGRVAQLQGGSSYDALLADILASGEYAGDIGA